MSTPTSIPPDLKDLGYIDPADLAAMLNLKPTTLANQRSAGIGPPFVRVHGNRIAYPLDGVKQWLAGRVVTPVQTPTLINPRKRRGNAA